MTDEVAKPVDEKELEDTEEVPEEQDDLQPIKTAPVVLDSEDERKDEPDKEKP